MLLKFSAFKFVWVFIVVIPLGCAYFGLHGPQFRFSENMNSSLTLPGNIDPPGLNQFSFAILGDTHIGNPAGGVLKDALSSAKTQGDAFVLVAGDLTDNGDIGQYRQFQTLFSDAGLPFRAAMGNHDIFFGGWDQWKAEIGRSIYSFNADNVHVVILDTANGMLGRDQINWLKQDLESATQVHKVVMTHYPVWNGRFASIFRMSSDEETAIVKDLFVRTGVRLVVSGHFHGYDEVTIGGVKYVVTGAANNLLDPGQRRHFLRVRISDSALTTEIIDLP
jgi:3',5'-cyclic AMP phosphodiesterase CpdA